ncbi:MAG: protein kinase family protein [Bacteriovoracaceae bacterium]|nr:protein kinase family protein [Bacteriovoracaceae bacterium]
MDKNNSFYLDEGDIISNRFTVLDKLGSGWEGEVYRVEEMLTKQERAIKLYYPKRNKKFKVSTRYAQKLEKLIDCPIVMNYLSHEIIFIGKNEVACLACEFIEGEILAQFVEKQRGKRLGIFPAIHLLYSLTQGVEAIHLEGEYHGDLHTENIIIKHFGLEFDIKILDFHHWGDSKQSNREEDIIKLIRIFYDILGGADRYPKLPPSIKHIICGLKRGLILKKFRSVSHLRVHLETMDWSDAV